MSTTPLLEQEAEQPAIDDRERWAVSQAHTPAKRRPIGELLIERGLITDTALQASLTEQALSGERLGTILVRNGLVTRKQLLESLHETGDPEVLSEPFESDKISHEKLLSLNTMILGDVDNTLIVASDKPRWYVERKLREDFPTHEIQWVDFDPEVLYDHMHKLAAYATENELDRILRQAVMQGVSDIHLVPKPLSYTLMFRHLGVRLIEREVSKEEAIRLIAQAKDRSSIDVADRTIPHDGAFRLPLLDRAVDFRVATIPETDGEKLVIRVLDPEAAFPKLESLGLRYVERWMEAASQPRGICLICGPTGSGKTTTLNATLRRLDRFGLSIQTVEDPVEYQLSYIGQVNVNRSRGLDFPRALRGFMRADPDVLIVGEIRDYETAKLAVQAAETGHMVFGTIHSDSAEGGLTRLRDLGVPTEDFANLIQASMAQKLVRTLCPSCSGRGCNDCQHEGYSGRTLVSEVAEFSGREDVEKALKGDAWWEPMLEDVEHRLMEGQTDEKETRRVFGMNALTITEWVLAHRARQEVQGYRAETDPRVKQREMFKK